MRARQRSICRVHVVSKLVINAAYDGLSVQRQPDEHGLSRGWGGPHSEAGRPFTDLCHPDREASRCQSPLLTPGWESVE